MRYPAIIFDLDGTAMPSVQNGMPSAQLVKTTNIFKNKIHLCAATGRSWPLAKGIIKALGLIDPCILSGGAVIADPVKEKILWQELIDQSSLEIILNVAQQHKYPVTYAYGLERVSKQPKEITQLPPGVNTFYILDIAGHEAIDMAEKLSAIPHITVSKAYSWSIKDGIDLHITNKRATKEHGVIELCRILGVNPVKVAGVGDGHNDIHLFNTVGHKVAMGNAVPELKELADEVIDTVDNDGLANFIEASVQPAA
jgi:HAD superfamily hydrolase (TIGR01484 family)